DFPGTITFTLNGQQIHSTRVSDSPSTVSFTYTPSSSGSGTVTATVTDSVLYSASASAPMNYTSKQPLTSFTANVGGSLTTFSWSGGSGNHRVTRADNGTELCSSGGSSCTASSLPGFAPAGTQVVLRDDDGNQLTATVQ